MIARRLAESLLFLEASSRTAADKEYADAIKRIIEEHARMREALEAISYLSDSERSVEIATDVLNQTVNGDSVEHDLELRDTLLKLSDMLLGDDYLRRVRADNSFFKTLIHKTLRQPISALRTHRFLHIKS